jgi:hypothetical protein
MFCTSSTVGSVGFDHGTFGQMIFVQSTKLQIISKPWKGRGMIFLPLVCPKTTFDTETHVPVANLLAGVAKIPVDGGGEGQDC